MLDTTVSKTHSNAILALALASFTFSSESRLEAQEHTDSSKATSTVTNQRRDQSTLSSVEISSGAELQETLLSFRIKGDKFIGSRSVTLPDTFAAQANSLTSKQNWEVIILNSQEIAERSIRAEGLLKDTYQTGMPFLLINTPANIHSNILFVIEQEDKGHSAVLFVSPATGPSYGAQLVAPVLSTLSGDLGSLFKAEELTLPILPIIYVGVTLSLAYLILSESSGT